MTLVWKLAVRPPAVVGGLVGLALLAVTAAPLFAQSSDETPSGDRMEQMMSAMHSEGASQGMRDMMGADAQVMMDQCMAMMSMMMDMMQNMPGMMGGQDGPPLQDMMPGMMGR